MSEQIITIVIRDADDDLLHRANYALIAAGFDGSYGELQTVEQYEAGGRPPLTIVPRRAHSLPGAVQADHTRENYEYLLKAAQGNLQRAQAAEGERDRLREVVRDWMSRLETQMKTAYNPGIASIPALTGMLSLAIPELRLAALAALDPPEDTP